MKLTTAQLYMLLPLRSGKQGWPYELIHYIWERANGTREEWEQLVQLGLVERRGRHYYCTLRGRKEFEIQKKGHWI